VVVRAGFSHTGCAGVSFFEVFWVGRGRIGGGEGRRGVGKIEVSWSPWVSFAVVFALLRW